MLALAGAGTTVAWSPPVGAATPTITAITAGFSHTCALTSTGGTKCWGYNLYGQLGDATSTDRSVPVDVTGLTSGVAAVAAAGNHTCALTTTGGVRCWGGNGYGQAGDGTLTDHSVPVDVSGLSGGVAAVALGAFHSCALTTAGGVKCWGLNDYGQLGDTTTTDRATPVDVAGLTSGVAAITAGGRQTCALTTAGGVKCWGHNFYGQLGDGTGTDSASPVDVAGLAGGVAAVSAGGRHTCARTSGAGMKCWGRNDFGQLGDGTTSNRFTPVDVSGLTSGVVAISAGRWHTCALVTGGAGKCWGNVYGMGDVGDSFSTAPEDVPGLSSGATALAAGEGHTCAVTSTGGVRCWGNNWAGQLGDGTTTGRLSAVDVVFSAPAAAATSTTITASPNPSTAGQVVTLTATVRPTSGTGTPTGTVVFKDGTTTLGRSTLSGGTATLAASWPAAGSHTLTAGYGGDASFAVSTSSPLTQTVNPADTGPPTLAVNDVSVTEGDAGTVAATFTVTLSKASAATVAVSAKTGDGTARAPGDYRATQAALRFSPGQTTRTVSVLVKGDTRVEGNETFTLALSAPSNATIADGSGRATIVDDD